jgi:hypothetical protein
MSSLFFGHGYTLHAEYNKTYYFVERNKSIIKTNKLNSDTGVPTRATRLFGQLAGQHANHIASLTA